MSQYKLTAAQQEMFQRMNQDAQIYGQTQVTDSEQQSFNRDGFVSTGDVFDRNMETSKKIKEMMKVDLNAAEALHKAYPDLYYLAKTEMKQLETTANMSSGEKVKQHDFFGFKRRAAREQVRQIKANRQKLEEQRFASAMEEVGETFQERRAEVLAGDSTNVVQARKRSIISGRTSLQYEMATLDKLYKASDSEAEIFVRSQEAINLPHTTADGKIKQYGLGSLYRDHMRVLTKPQGKVTATREQQAEFLDAQYVLQTGRHLEDAEKGPDGKPTSVPDEVLERSFHTVYAASKTSIADLDAIFKQHPLWDDAANAPADMLMKEYSLIQSTYQKAQATDQTFSLLFDHPLFAEQGYTTQRIVFDHLIRVKCYREVLGGVSSRIKAAIMNAHGESSDQLAIQSMASVRESVLNTFGADVHGRREKYPDLFN